MIYDVLTIKLRPRKFNAASRRMYNAAFVMQFVFVVMQNARFLLGK